MIDPRDAGTGGTIIIGGNLLAHMVPPRALPGFPGAKPAKPKTPIGGGAGKRRRWKNPDDGTIFEWDYQHGRVEKYDRRGKHLGEFDPVTGQRTKGADPDRSIEP